MSEYDRYCFSGVGLGRLFALVAGVGGYEHMIHMRKGRENGRISHYCELRELSRTAGIVTPIRPTAWMHPGRQHSLCRAYQE